MKKTLTISHEIECGEKTCASKPGKFCPMLTATHFGTRPICGVFYVALYVDKHGTLGAKEAAQRCPQCLENSK